MDNTPSLPSPPARISTPNRRRRNRNYPQSPDVKSRTPNARQSRNNIATTTATNNNNNNNNTNASDESRAQSKPRSRSSHKNNKPNNARRVKSDSGTPQQACAVKTPESAPELADDHAELMSTPTRISSGSYSDDKALFAGTSFWQSPAPSSLPLPMFCKPRASPSGPVPLVFVHADETGTQRSFDSTDSSSESEDGVWSVSDVDARGSDSASTATTTPGRSLAQLADDNDDGNDVEKNKKDNEPSPCRLATEPIGFRSLLDSASREQSHAPSTLSPRMEHQFSLPSFYAGNSLGPSSVHNTISPDEFREHTAPPLSSSKLSFNERLAQARPGYSPPAASSQPSQRPIASDWTKSPPQSTSLPSRAPTAVQADGQRLDWSSIYGNQGPRSPEIVSLENQLLTLLRG